jgi:thiamine biosynthesis lipoprotein
VQFAARRVLVPLDLPPVVPAIARPDATVHALRGETMGTAWSVKFAAPPRYALRPIFADIVGVLDAIVAQMSTWIADSDISRFNRAAPASWMEIPDDFRRVLHHALTLSQETGGAFDPTIGALVDSWGFGPAGRQGEMPSENSVADAARDWSRFKLSGTRALQPGGIQLDLSGIAKGYAVDRVADLLDRRGLANHLVEIGGELRGIGAKPDGSPWWVELESMPPVLATVVALHDLSVATSGDSQRYFMHEGRRMSHTIDPRTGRPVSDRLASVTVLHRRCMHADALATALTVMGPERGLAYAEARGLAARFILRMSESYEERVTPTFAAMSD